MDLLKEQGCRITRQRRQIVDTILQKDFETSKDIYYLVKRVDPSIGMATVYRMIRQLEEIGVLNRIERLELTPRWKH